jgi:Cu/Ag efflux protein CusF
MRLWKVVALVDLALLLGVGFGYVWWGRPVAQLRRELADARAGQIGGVRDFRGEGIVRAVLPDIGVIVITHGDIPGFMPPMTMGFRTGGAGLLDSVTVGDSVRFVLRGVPPNVTVVGIEKLPS